MLRRSIVVAQNFAFCAPPLLGPHVRATHDQSIPVGAAPLMRLKIATPARRPPMGVRDVLVVPSFAASEERLFARLVDELRAAPQLKPIHDERPHLGSTRYDVVQPPKWVSSMPTLHDTVERVSDYLGFSREHGSRISARLNYYHDRHDSKPFHTDGHGFADSPGFPSLASKQCVTAILSLGSTRTLAFQRGPLFRNAGPDGSEMPSECPGGDVAVELHDGTLLAFARDVNLIFRHGVLPVGSKSSGSGARYEKGVDNCKLLDSVSAESRISIAIMGWVDLAEEQFA